MPKTIDYYKGLWSEMIENDKRKVDHFKEIDNAIEFGLKLPEDLRKLKWMRNIQSTLPAEVMVVGTKILSTIEPKVYYQPVNSSEANKKKANEIEQNLLWQIVQMDKRTPQGIVPNIVESALRYDSTAAFTVPVTWQIGGQKGERPSRYEKSAFNQGGFITVVHNPKDIHARWSPLGLDMVLSAKVMRARDAIAFYGEDANKIAELMKDEKNELYVSVFDYWDYDDRITWISKPSDNMQLAEPDGGYIISKKEMELPFLPWSINEGGSTLASSPEHGVRPLLGPIVHADQLELQMIVQSMAMSEATAYAASPRVKITSHDGETIEIRYGDINQPVVLKPGEQYEMLPPHQIDTNLLAIFDRLEQSFSKLTGLRSLADLDTPSGTAYATVNAQIKAATSSLDPAKRLSERTLSGIAENILRWTAHTGDDLIGYGSQDGNVGIEYRTQSKHIDPKDIYVSVTLSHHIPTDELQQINAVTILMKEVGISFVDAAKKLDIPNPEELQARYRQEQLDNAQVAIAIKKMNAEADLEIQAMQMQMQMGMQQQVQQQQIAQQQQMQGGGMNEESMSQLRMAQGGMPDGRTGAPRREAQSLAARGPMYNPARGGLSPNTANPGGFTKEAMTGVDREGEVI